MNTVSWLAASRDPFYLIDKALTIFGHNIPFFGTSNISEIYPIIYNGLNLSNHFVNSRKKNTIFTYLYVFTANALEFMYVTRCNEWQAKVLLRTVEYLLYQ